jgi:hypothetical protein
VNECEAETLVASGEWVRASTIRKLLNDLALRKLKEAGALWDAEKRAYTLHALRVALDEAESVSSERFELRTVKRPQYCHDSGGLQFLVGNDAVYKLTPTMCEGLFKLLWISRDDVVARI